MVLRWDDFISCFIPPIYSSKVNDDTYVVPGEDSSIVYMSNVRCFFVFNNVDRFKF